MFKKIIFFIIGISFFNFYGQFQFSGSVNGNFKDATAYLSIVNDCSKKNLFLTEDIIQESQINADLEFNFTGDFLATQNRIYKIHIDNCNENVGDYKHLLNHCEESKEIIFIANNKDVIHFPLNDLTQIFCDVEYTNSNNIALSHIDVLQEDLLSNLQFSKSDLQRTNIYKKHFKVLQDFGKTFNEPLAELYTFYLYANDNSISKDFYLKDLKKSTYYKELLYKLDEKYPDTTYTNKYRNTLENSQYLTQGKKPPFKLIAFAVSFLLLLSLVFNYFQIRKKKKQAIVEVKKIDYKKVLTTQEQKVFELMLDNPNKEIANLLFVSISTIKTHINNIYSKLGISSRKEIAQFFN